MSRVYELAGKAHDSRETVRLSSATWENLNTWFSHINKSYTGRLSVGKRILFWRSK